MVTSSLPPEPPAPPPARVAGLRKRWLALPLGLALAAFVTAALLESSPAPAPMGAVGEPVAVSDASTLPDPAPEPEPAPVPLAPVAWEAPLLAELEASARRERSLRDRLLLQEQSLAAAQAGNEHLKTELAALHERQRVTHSQLTVAETTRAHLTGDLAQARQEIAQLRQSVAFYERLIPDGSPTGRVSIRSAELHALNDTLLQYRVLVMRHGPSTEPFQGKLQFLATGTRGGSSATIALERLANAPTSSGGTAASANAAEPGLNFRQYQRASGLLALPPGFTPVTITVRVLEGKAIRAEHTITLSKESPS